MLLCTVPICYNINGQEPLNTIALPSQPDSTYRYYAELLGFGTNFFGLNKNVIVEVDLGQNSSRYKNQLLLDEEGKRIKFNSMVAAMNYMGQRGWKFVQTYVVTTLNQNVYHWLMYKDVHNNHELLEGINIKDVDEDFDFEVEKDKKKKKNKTKKNDDIQDDIYF